MSDPSGIRVYVLGAGCSCDSQHGYPLAKEFGPVLNEYAAKIAGVAESQRIRQAVEDTVKLLTACQTGSCHASSIDQLINLIWNNQCDDELMALKGHRGADRVALRYGAVRNAKIATAACFLDREGPALQQQMGKYKEFILRRVLDETGSSVPTQARLARSTARVLTFNYDRLFELAFYAGFADDHLRSFSGYEAQALNSGLTTFGGVGDFAKDRFCFLKLHGSAGVICSDGAFGQETEHLRSVVKWKDDRVTDTRLFPASPAGVIVSAPMIIFPYEKDFVVSGRDNTLPFRDYVTRVWAHASYVLQQASEIWIIGYSFDPTDCKYLVDLLKQARKCERIVIQNLPAECERIEALLRIDYRFQIRIEKYPAPF